MRRRKREKKGEKLPHPPPHSSLEHFTLRQFLLGPSSCVQTLQAGASFYTRYEPRNYQSTLLREIFFPFIFRAEHATRVRFATARGSGLAARYLLVVVFYCLPLSSNCFGSLFLLVLLFSQPIYLTILTGAWRLISLNDGKTVATLIAPHVTVACGAGTRQALWQTKHLFFKSTRNSLPFN